MGDTSATGSPPLVIGRYELHAVIASGGMATVHFGRLTGPGGFTRTVAISASGPMYAHDPDFVSMFVDEARLASKIRHPNVVSTLDVVSTPDPELFLVMDYVQGETLARLLSAARVTTRPPPPRVVSAILAGVLRGLHAAHEASHPTRGPLGIVHRDVSPQNIMVGIDGTARLVDFGVAKAVHRLQVTRDHQLKGKVPYMAPEQLDGRPVTRAADVFAASVVLWEALTARRLFAASREPAVMKQIVDAPIEPPSRFLARESIAAMDALDAVVLRGLERDPARRWPTAREMAVALEAALPPAPTSEVGEWVEATARGKLDERSAYLARLASSASIARALPERPDPVMALANSDAKYTSRPRAAMARASVRPSRAPPTKARRALHALEKSAPYAAVAGILGLLALAASLVYLLTKL